MPNPQGQFKKSPNASTKKPRGRTSITPAAQAGQANPTAPHVPQELRREATRPISSGGGKHRGDRRDMSKTYSGNLRHAARGNNPRADVKTRKR